MPVVTPSMYAQSMTRAGRLTGMAWTQRCDQLAVEQRFVFLELLSFGRDGTSGEHVVALMNYLSTLQDLAKGISAEASRPIEVEELAPAVERATLYFGKAAAGDAKHEKRTHRGWLASVAAEQPVIWAACTELLQSTGMIHTDLGVGITITLYALTDCYARRFSAHDTAGHPTA